MAALDDLSCGAARLKSLTHTRVEIVGKFVFPSTQIPPVNDRGRTLTCRHDSRLVDTEYSRSSTQHVFSTVVKCIQHGISSEKHQYRIEMRFFFFPLKKIIKNQHRFIPLLSTRLIFLSFFQIKHCNISWKIPSIFVHTNQTAVHFKTEYNM